MTPLFSIGYEQLTPLELATLIRQLDAVVLDVRSFAWGRVKRGFSRTDLQKLLPGRYEWRGDALGGKGQGTTADGLGRVADDVAKAKRPYCLMCKEAAPGDCHRFHSIAVPLLALGIDVLHIHEQEVVATRELKRAIDEDDGYECRPLADYLTEPD